MRVFELKGLGLKFSGCGPFDLKPQMSKAAATVSVGSWPYLEDQLALNGIGRTSTLQHQAFVSLAIGVCANYLVSLDDRSQKKKPTFLHLRECSNPF